MASYNPGDSLSQRAPTSSRTARTLSHADSSPEPPKTSRSTKGTETPYEPVQIFHAFEAPTPDPLAIGNPSLELALKLKGKLGYFVNRDKVKTDPMFIPLNISNYRDAINRTLYTACERLLRLAGHIEVQNIVATARNLAIALSNGITVMTYVRLRRVNSLEATQLNKFCKRPKVPDTLEVPAPFALAISQLGILEASSLNEEVIYIPTIPEDSANFCLPTGVYWSTASYLQAMEYGKKIGLTFQSVDLSVPLGSSWWLYRPDITDSLFSLQCALPEDNYTEATAVLYSLFCSNGTGGLFNEIFDLSSLEAHDYGAMLRNPHADINVSSYFAIEEAPETIWKVV